jgi:hypothetical protein
MRIVGAMAAVAILGELVFIVFGGMTAGARNYGMRAEQGKARFLEMVEFGGFPVIVRVTFAAIDAAIALVNVVGRMAIAAALRGVFVARPEVAGIAGDFQMRAVQRELCLAVIETVFAPGARVVAVCAQFAERPQVDVIVLMAVHAAGECFAIRHIGFVAGRAGNAFVSTLHREICQRVIEGRRIETNNIGAAALVLRVAGAAFAFAGVQHVPVVAMFSADIGGGVFMAIEAQRRLPATVGAIVAQRTGLLFFHMRAADLARHQQGFDLGGVDPFGNRNLAEGDGCHDDESYDKPHGCPNTQGTTWLMTRCTLGFDFGSSVALLPCKSPLCGSA